MQSLDSMLANPDNAEISTDSTTAIMMYPVYSWGTPPVVINLINKAKFSIAPQTVFHLVLTCGDDCGLAAQQWRKVMMARGIPTGSAWSVQMPNTYVCMSGFDIDEQAVANKKIESSDKRLCQIANEIQSFAKTDGNSHINSTTDVVTGKFATIKTKIIYPWFVRHAMSPKPFRHTNACVTCGKCMRNCPMQNIRADENGAPLWGNVCAMCLRCYHICPTHAIEYGNKTAKKGQWNHFLK